MRRGGGAGKEAWEGGKREGEGERVIRWARTEGQLRREGKRGAGGQEGGGGRKGGGKGEGVKGGKGSELQRSLCPHALI